MDYGLVLIKNEQETLAIAAQFAKRCHPPLVIYLKGQLGAGKTTFTRGFLQGLGYTGKVKSPTYTLVETYLFEGFEVCHFDLYRVHDPEELELIGIRDYFNDHSICLIEWPEQGQGILPPADILCHFCVVTQGRRLEISYREQGGTTQQIG